MLAKWPIRNKLLVGIGLLAVIVAALSTSGFLGVYAYRGLLRDLRSRADELPLATALATKVSDLRVGLAKVGAARPDSSAAAARSQFRDKFDAVQAALDDYCNQLNQYDQDDVPIGDNHQEQATVSHLRQTLADVDEITAKSKDWTSDTGNQKVLAEKLETTQTLTAELPSFLHHRLHDLAGDVRAQYRALIGVNLVTTISALLLFGLLVNLFYRWVFRPLGVLIRGSRNVAKGDFNYRIRLESHDEMAELAQALNDMTARFQAVRDDLDHQVQVRTKQIVRSEQLASVGFLAAGVAHEINNPLASIAMCAESLEGRLGDRGQGTGDSDADKEVFGRYLRMIQTEAFRCKGITEKLLDFSRLGDVQHQNADLRELIDGVIEMVGHLGKYNEKQIRFSPGAAVVAPVNGQEIKQVVLNLITNALDALDPGGILSIDLRANAPNAEMIFTDNGCGMTADVLEHLFEPFFTRKRGVQGTGLGLSIVYRIVTDHGGQIEAASAGAGHGSQFRVTLPLADSSNSASHKETSHRYQAA